MPISVSSGRSRQAIIRLVSDRMTDSLLLSTMQPGQLLCDRYRIEKALAKGGFGETFLAVDNHLPSKPQVVVKLLKPIYNDPGTLKIAQRLFNMEAEALEQLGKDNDRIPSLYAYFELKGEFYLVQEYIEGETLTEELQERKISESDTLAILQEILTGLTNVHRKGKIHRDLKPDNIIRRAQDRKLVLIDFGAVKQSRTATTNPNLVSRTIIDCQTEAVSISPFELMRHCRDCCWACQKAAYRSPLAINSAVSRSVKYPLPSARW